MAKAQSVERRAAGLYTQWNQFEAPEGALLEADNMVIDREHLIQNRRGFNRFGNQLSGPPSAFLDFKNSIVVLDGAVLKHDNGGTGLWSSWDGTFVSPESNRRLRGIEVRSALYFTSSVGIYRNDSISNSPVRAGLPQPLEGSQELPNASGFLLPENKVSYRLVFMREDANGVQVFSAPTPRLILISDQPTSTRRTQIDIHLPPEIIAGDQVWAYRTPQASPAEDLGDDHQLAKIQTINSSHINSGTLRLIDKTPEISLSELLYTNPTEETITQANGVPPLSKDLALFKGYTFYGNTTQPHEMTFRMVEMEDPTTAEGPQDNDVITFQRGVSTYSFTAKISPSAATDFHLEKTLDTDSDNINATIHSLVGTINGEFSLGNVPFFARFVTGEADPPGMINIVMGDFLTTPLTVWSSSSDIFKEAFDPPLTEGPTDSGVVKTLQDVFPNGLYHSKFEQPDAVPFLNFDVVGSEESPIIRILKLRDSLIIIKEEGIWRLTGDTDVDFILKEVDPSVKILGADTAVSLNNAVYCMSTQGVVKIDEFGVQIISRPIESDLKTLSSLSSFNDLSFGIGYEEQRKYILFVPTLSSDSVATQAYVYNYISRAWTKWKKPCGAGIVLFNTDTLYLGHGVDSYVLKERKSFLGSTDYKDETIEATAIDTDVTALSGGSAVSVVDVVWTYTGEALSPGFFFEFGAQKALVSSVVELSMENTFRLTLDALLDLPSGGGAPVGDAGWAGLLALTTGVVDGSAGSNFGISMSLPVATRTRWAPEAAGNPAQLKQFSRAVLSMEENTALGYTLSFFSDYDPEETALSEIRIGRTASWGLGSWGDLSWGGARLAATPIGTVIPRNVQKCRALSIILEHSRAEERFAISNLSYSFRPIGDRVVRTPA